MNTVTSKLRATFLELIKLGEVYPHEDAVISYCLKRLQKEGVAVQQDSYGNIVATVTGAGEPILLSTHLDIPEPNSDLSYLEEETIIRSDGKSILGADPMTGLAVLLEFMDAIRSHNTRHRPVEVLLTRGEETGLLGAVHADYSLLTATQAIVLDENGPITKLVRRAPSYVRFDATLQGKTGHPRLPEAGVNALQAVVVALANLPWGYACDGVTWNIGKMEAGTARNSIPGNVSFQAELRGFDSEQVIREAKRLEREITQHAEAVPGVRCTIDHEFEFEGYAISQDDPFMAAVTGALKEMGLQPDVYETFGGSDASVFNARGITALAMGAGYYNAHHYDEYADLADMATIVDFLHLVVGAEKPEGS